jgi:hypothetical protein
MFQIFSTYICSINILNATLEVNSAVRPLYGSLGVKGLTEYLPPPKKNPALFRLHLHSSSPGAVIFSTVTRSNK